MSQVKFAPAAILDLQRLREFLQPKNPEAAKRAGSVIKRALAVLGLQAKMGRHIEDMPDEYREWVIDFGDSGYLARYRLDGDAITILAIRHQKELAHGHSSD